MEYFEKYRSNTTAGSANQHFFINEKGTTTAAMLYRLTQGGEFCYSFLFSNTIDSTYASGKVSHKNLVLDSWEISSLRAGITDSCDENGFEMPTNLKDILFCGSKNKTVNPAGLFCTDPVTLCAKSGQYLYLEIVFSGRSIPYHDESIIPSFVKENGKWIKSNFHPFPSMIGATLPPKKKIAFLGDSITQGLGTPINSYLHWNAVLADSLGNDYAYWNLGIGFGRAEDAASDGIWLFKAKQNDIVFVCFGVNDIIRNFDAQTISQNLQTIVDKLKAEGVFVIVQTVPPFELCIEHREVWYKVNDFIKNRLSDADFIFDCAEFLADEKGDPIYGGHPDAAGCKLWADKLFEQLKEVL